MPQTAAVREDLQIIQIDGYGEVTPEDLKESLEAALRIHQERGLTKVFVDATRMTSFPSTLPTIEFGSDLAEEPARGLRFAVVSVPEMHDGLKLLEIVAHNRGGQMRMFDSTDDALRWLAEGPDETDEEESKQPHSDSS